MMPALGEGLELTYSKQNDLAQQAGEQAQPQQEIAPPRDSCQGHFCSRQQHPRAADGYFHERQSLGSDG